MSYVPYSINFQVHFTSQYEIIKVEKQQLKAPCIFFKNKGAMIVFANGLIFVDYLEGDSNG